jgi:hypothetical protein
MIILPKFEVKVKEKKVAKMTRKKVKTGKTIRDREDGGIIWL